MALFEWYLLMKNKEHVLYVEMSQPLYCRLCINVTSFCSELPRPISWRSPPETELLFIVPFNLPPSLCLTQCLSFFFFINWPPTQFPPQVTSSASSHWNCLSDSVHFEIAQVYLLRHMFSFGEKF